MVEAHVDRRYNCIVDNARALLFALRANVESSVRPNEEIYGRESMETPPSFPLLSYSPLSLSVLLFFFPSSLFFRFHRLIDINPRYPAVYHAALPTIPFVEPPFPLRFRRCSTWVNYESDIRGKYRYGNIGGGESGEFISMVLLRRSALLPLDGVDHEWRETNLSR